MEDMVNALTHSDVGHEAQEPVVAAPSLEAGLSEPADFATPQPAAETADEEQEQPYRPPQSREDNALAKAARLAGQREAEERLRQEYEEKLAALNPQDGQELPDGAPQPAPGLSARLAEALRQRLSPAAGMAPPQDAQALTALREAKQQKGLEIELLQAKQQLALREIERELGALKQKFPEIKADNAFELGEDFVKLRQAGVSPEAAYLAAQGAERLNARPAPPSMGLLSREAPEKEFYSPEELNALTDKDLDNPHVLDRALRSLSRHR